MSGGSRKLREEPEPKAQSSARMFCTDSATVLPKSDCLSTTSGSSAVSCSGKDSACCSGVSSAAQIQFQIRTRPLRASRRDAAPVTRDVTMTGILPRGVPEDTRSVPGDTGCAERRAAKDTQGMLESTQGGLAMSLQRGDLSQ